MPNGKFIKSEKLTEILTFINRIFLSMQETLGQEDPREEGMATHPVFSPGEFDGQRSLVGYSP